MKAVLAIIEDDAGRVMVLQDREGQPGLPRAELEATQGPLKVLRRTVVEGTGLEIAGWAEMSVLSKEKHQMHGYRAHITGGKARQFPTKDHLSLSWVAPDLAVKILTGEATHHFLKDRYPYLY